MIGAMPAVAVRQQRKHVKHEEHKRPTVLTIEANSGYVGLPTPIRPSPRTSPHVSPAASPKHSPVTSPRTQSHKHGDSQGCAHRCVNGYLCGRVSLLHVSVVCVLLGITLLVVGLVQLAPGAGSDINKYAIIGAGTGFLGLGFLFLILLCACQKNTHRRRRPLPHLIQAHPNHKGKTGSGRSNKSHTRGHSRQMQVHTVEGAVSAGGEGGCHGDRGEGGCHGDRGEGGCHAERGEGGCHGERGARGHPGGGVQLRTVNEKDVSLEGFVKSPSESDALIESTCRRQ